jgi:ATP-dependent helicase/nuclease subunit A
MSSTVQNSREQTLASDPEYSIWLSASAGTGKTKVLTDRVLRLLLAKVELSKILCLTFTNAAANEMKKRIYEMLKHWSLLSVKGLKVELEMLTGGAIKNEEIFYAQSLLSKYLEKSESLNIYTIHSFCQKILRQFPIEAGVSPNFKIIDEINQQKIFFLIKHSIITDPSLQPLTSRILGVMHEMRLNELIAEILSDKIKFKYLFGQFSNDLVYQQYLQRVLKIANVDSVTSIIKNSQILLSKYIDKVVNNEVKEALIDYVQTTSICPTKHVLKSFFLTLDGKKKKKLLTKAIQEKYPEQLNYLLSIQEIISDTLDQIKAFRLLHSSIDLYNLAKNLIEKYDDYKNQRGFLDYDDLIYYTYQLFTTSEFKDWILYKLDGGIEHILVDEAQDTNLNQWKLILEMIRDFVAGESINNANKSIFIVGDEKQSIYSFQGAEYEQFNEIKCQILEQLADAHKKHREINLGTSYRSSELILSTVNRIFNHIRYVDPCLFDANNFALKCHLESYGGEVELWDLYCDSQDENVFWPILQDSHIASAKNILAKKIALYIQNLLSSKKVLFATGKSVEPRDIMILLRQRNDFAHKLVKELKNLQIPVSGLDRINLFEDLSVKDLLAAAKFALSPQNELNLACLLKSPIIKMSESDLFKLLHGRKQNLYLQISTIAEYLEVKNKLGQITELAHAVSLSDFFHILIYGYNHLSDFLANNGHESLDSINELINLSLQFERQVSGSLQDFVSWCNSCKMEFARDTNQGNVVQIMTVHASKGLQSPIVLLPETTSMPRIKEYFLWNADGCPFLAINAAQSPKYYTDLKQLEGEKQYKEYLRLLYVATTRAREHLVFCGYASGEAANDKSWYSLISNAMKADLSKGKILEDTTIFTKCSEHERPTLSSHVKNIEPLPLIHFDAQYNYIIKNPVIGKSINSPLREQDLAFYGQVVHKILEESLSQKNLDMLVSHRLFDLLPDDYALLVKSRLAKLFHHPDFQALLGSIIRCEVSVSHQAPNKLGRIDLMSILGNSITIFDYKTDKNVPIVIDDVPVNYIEQITAYKNAIQAIYPDHCVTAKIVWIMDASIMEV